MYTYVRRCCSFHRAEAGQASVEYALVLLGAALVATLLISWATSTDLIGSLFSYVIGLVRSKAT